MPQTIFPNIIVEEIRAENHRRGRTVKFDPPAVGEGEGDLPGLIDSLTERVKSLIERVNPIGDEKTKITYKLQVGATTRATAKAKSRLFVRAKNPFEPDFSAVVVEEMEDMGMMSGPMKAYEVHIEIEK